MKTTVGSWSVTTKKYRCAPCTEHFVTVRPRSEDTLIHFSRADLSNPVKCAECGGVIPS